MFQHERGPHWILASHRGVCCGTFFSCQSVFYQLHRQRWDDFTFNVAYFLLPGESRDVYVEAFEHFRNAVEGLNLSLSLELVRTDWHSAYSGATFRLPRKPSLQLSFSFFASGLAQSSGAGTFGSISLRPFRCSICKENYKHRLSPS